MPFPSVLKEVHTAPCGAKRNNSYKNPRKIEKC